ncbi:hypothetical protein NHQ30_005917 [Ciborinia camelliae]|nr:hypothetical protein NHQ30_005917 [Ciborinia camelliae]
MSLIYIYIDIGIENITITLHHHRNIARQHIETSYFSIIHYPSLPDFADSAFISCESKAMSDNSGQESRNLESNMPRDPFEPFEYKFTSMSLLSSGFPPGSLPGEEPVPVTRQSQVYRSMTPLPPQPLPQQFRLSPPQTQEFVSSLLPPRAQYVSPYSPRPPPNQMVELDNQYAAQPGNTSQQNIAFQYYNENPYSQSHQPFMDNRYPIQQPTEYISPYSPRPPPNQMVQLDNQYAAPPGNTSQQNIARPPQSYNESPYNQPRQPEYAYPYYPQ